MINLKDLEKEIDALLESETPESLREWLSNNKVNDISCYVGDGHYQNILFGDQNYELPMSNPALEPVCDNEHNNNECFVELDLALAA